MFLLLLLGGVGALGYGGYAYFDGKAKEKESAIAADVILENREIDSLDTEPTLNDLWEAKQAFEASGIDNGDVIGKLVIPKLEGELPVVSGVNPDDLMKGVGHDSDTFLPLDDQQTVLSGHRDTVFRGIGKLELGDTMTLQLPYGDFEYKIVDMYIVDADDLTVIVPRPSEVLTVTTCYPFDFIGHAPDRYIIEAEPMFDMSELMVAR